MKTLIIGHGQLGAAVARRLAPGPVFRAVVPWEDPVAASESLRASVHRFFSAAGSGRSAICWCAGAGVVGTGDLALTAERTHLAVVLDAIDGCGVPTFPNKFFLASSAGGVYADVRAVADERTPPAPTSAYGHSKVLQVKWSRRGVEIARRTC